MLEETVGHFLQGKPHVLEADLLAHHVERRGWKSVVHRAHHSQQYRAVADASVEHAQRRRARMDIGEFERNPAGDHPFFAAGADEEEIFLPVIEEAEIALRIARAGGHWRCGRPRLAWTLDDGGTRRRRPVILHEAADAFEGLGGDAAAVTQPRGELAVVDGAATEGRFRYPGVAAIFGDLLQ